MRGSRDSISFSGAIFQSLSSAGPMLNLFGLLPVIVGIAFRLSFIVVSISTAIGFLTVYTSYTFSRYMRTNGGYYSYVGSILGKRAGVFTSVIYLSYGFLTLPSIILFLDFFTASVLPGTFISGIYGQILISLIALTVILAITVSKFRITMNYIIGSSITEIAVISIIVAYILLNYSPHPIPVKNISVSSLMMALPFGILSFAGIGSSIFLSDNTRNWKKNTNRSVMASFLLLSILMIVPASVFSIYLGNGSLAAYSSSPILAFNLGSSYAGRALSIILVIVAMNSAVNLSVGYLNAFRRAVEKMSGDGIIKNSLQLAGKRKFYILVFSIALIIALSCIITAGSYTGFIIISGAVSLTFLVVHTISNTALVKFFYSKGNRLRTAVPIFSVASFIFILVEESRIPGELRIPSAIALFAILLAASVTLFHENNRSYYSGIKFNVETPDS